MSLLPYLSMNKEVYSCNTGRSWITRMCANFLWLSETITTETNFQGVQIFHSNVRIFRSSARTKRWDLNILRMSFVQAKRSNMFSAELCAYPHATGICTGKLTETFPLRNFLIQWCLKTAIVPMQRHLNKIRGGGISKWQVTKFFVFMLHVTEDGSI